MPDEDEIEKVVKKRVVRPKNPDGKCRISVEEGGAVSIKCDGSKNIHLERKDVKIANAVSDLSVHITKKEIEARKFKARVLPDDEDEEKGDS